LLDKREEEFVVEFSEDVLEGKIMTALDDEFEIGTLL
jgi:hypothetical protein